MNISRFIARRYLFSKKSKSIINIISAISVIGIFVSSASMIIVLSGFNGIEQLVEEMYSKHDADLVLSSKEGKTFICDPLFLNKIKSIPEISNISRIIEETAMIKKGDFSVIATIKGVDSSYHNIIDLDSFIIEGTSLLKFKNSPLSIIGFGLRDQLQATSNTRYDNTIMVYGLQRDQKLSVQNKNAFHPEQIEVGGVFNIAELNDRHVIVPLSFAQKLFNYQKDISSIEIALNDNIKTEVFKLKLMEIIGDSYQIKTQYEKNELLFKTNAAEKWIVFLILIFILILSTFNIIASLTMLILDKKKDISTLISIGATQKLIRTIFFKEGLYINILGGFLGLFFGTLICLIQIKFHIVKLENSVISYWPVQIEILDLIAVVLILLLIGLFSSYLPTTFLIKKHFKGYFN